MSGEWTAPCDWPDDPAELERQLAAAEAAYDREREQAHVDLHGEPAPVRTVVSQAPPEAYRDIDTVHVAGGLL
ncbi:hypothetical protein ACFWDI_28175 [Streptomyces sp. NPDC060064]|uniref:hypothetical protein n=1 Tax=Streptomyces sp. NPDC060064 TaxID=3347049 RepID=UPI0036AE2CA1